MSAIGNFSTPLSWIFRSASSGDSIADCILSFRVLPSGWCYGKGVPAREKAIVSALFVLRTLREAGASSVEAFPDPDGGVLVSGYNGHDTVDVLCKSGGGFSMVHDVDDSEVLDKPSIDLAEITEYLKGLRWRCQKSSDLFTQSTIVMKRDDSRASHSKTRPGTGEYLSLTANAPAEKAADQSVSIFANDIVQKFPEALQYSGEFKLFHSRQTAA